MAENDIVLEAPSRVEVIFLYAPSIILPDVRHLERHGLPMRVPETMLGSQVIAKAAATLAKRIKDHFYPVPIKRPPKVGDLVFLDGADVPIHSQLWIVEPDNALTVLSPTFDVSRWLDTPLTEKRKGSRYCFSQEHYCNSPAGSPLVGDSFIDGMPDKLHSLIERVSLKKLTETIDIEQFTGPVIYAAYLHTSIKIGFMVVRDHIDDDWSTVVVSNEITTDIGTPPAVSVNHKTMDDAKKSGIDLLLRVLEHGRDPRGNVLCNAAVEKREISDTELAELNKLHDEWKYKPLKDIQCPN